MRIPLSSLHRRNRSAGMTLLEAVLALLLLSICLVPAANALHAAIQGPGVAAQAARELDCVSSRMETVLAEPYTRLLAAAGSATAASSFSTSGDAACPALKVVIARYGVNSTRKIGPGGTGNYLLHVNVELAAANDGNRFALATLVTQ